MSSDSNFNNRNNNNLNKQTFSCAGKQVAFYRKRKGITQKTLAQKAGYSERLVRKAEASGSLSVAAIDDFATVLSSECKPVHREDLIYCPEQMARAVLSAYAQYEAEMVGQIEHFLHEDVLVRCAGDPEKIPFAGEWHGRDGFDRWARTFFATLTRPDKNFYQPTFLASGNTAVAWGQEWACVPGTTNSPIWILQRFEFQKGKLCLFEDLFDTDSGSEHLAEARARGFLTD